jgi:hypothetical protein
MEIKVGDMFQHYTWKQDPHKPCRVIILAVSDTEIGYRTADLTNEHRTVSKRVVFETYYEKVLSHLLTNRNGLI